MGTGSIEVGRHCVRTTRRVATRQRLQRLDAAHIARAARSRRSVEDVVELVTSAREEEGVETSSHRRRLLAGMGGLVGSMVVSGIDGASAESESTGYDPNESREANRRENSMAALQGKLLPDSSRHIGSVAIGRGMGKARHTSERRPQDR